MMTMGDPWDFLRQLNCGSGRFPVAGCVNVDISLETKPDTVCDLDRFPYPFRDCQFARISASHVLEHLDHPLQAMAEWHRMLRPGGELRLRVPHFSRGFTHPDHRRGFDISFPLFFSEDMTPWFTGTVFELKKMRLRWNAQPYLKTHVASPVARAIARVLGFAIDTLANFSPILTSRLLVFWVGGFEEIEFVFRRPDRDL
jgi:SAM-dependent methyltransferase